MARRLLRGLSLIVVAGLAASILAACGGDFEFKPGGAGRGQGVVYSAPPQTLYQTATPSPGS